MYRSVFEDALLKELLAVAECIDLRYISQRSSFTEGGTWNLAGRVEAAMKGTEKLAHFWACRKPTSTRFWVKAPRE